MRPIAINRLTRWMMMHRRLARRSGRHAAATGKPTSSFCAARRSSSLDHCSGGTGSESRQHSLLCDGGRRSHPVQLSINQMKQFVTRLATRTET